MLETWVLSYMKGIFIGNIMKRKKIKLLNLNIQRMIIAICVMLVCIATQRIQTVKWDTGIIELSRDSLGILMALIIMTNYKWTDVAKYKKIYLSWAIVGAIAGVCFTPAMIARRAIFLKVDTIIIALGMYLIGFCIIHTIINVTVNMYRPKLYKPLLIIWSTMLLWMIYSRTEYLWPEAYFILFLCYYFTEQTNEQRCNTVHGMMDGIILGFMVIQAHALLCRPYDRVRYVGNFCNPNHNCAFLCICLAGILAKILFISSAKCAKWVMGFYFMLLGACYALICMTVSRTGYITAVLLTIIFLIAYCIVNRKRVFFRMGILLVVIFLFALPVTYTAVRYIPTIHPHVIFYFQEGYSSERVTSMDPRDSHKYVSFEQLMNNVLGRFRLLLPQYMYQTFEQGGDESELKIASNVNTIPRGILLTMVNDGRAVVSEEVDRDKIPALTYEESRNAFLVRYTIYEWYFKHLSIRGMPYDEQGFQLTDNHWIQDTHNIYLDYGINFGYPVMIMFAVFVWWGILRLAKQGICGRNVKKIGALLIVFVPPIFGLLEFVWGAGMISTVAFYMCFKEMLED